MKFTRLLFIPALFLVAVACNNELDINAEYEEIAVVYSLLDPKDDTQWVRIERGYLGNKPASESFDEPDSLYYENLSATLIEIDENGVETRIPLFRDDVSRERNNNGPFTTNAFRLYRTDGTYLINTFSTYNVEIVANNNEPITLSNNINVIRATSSGAILGLPNLVDISTPRQASVSPPIFNQAIEWETNTGYKSEVLVQFHYTEYNPTTKVKVLKSFTRNLGFTTDNSMDYRFRQLYENINNNLQEDPSVIRFFRKLSLKVTIVGRELDTYSNLNIPTTGIIQSRPEFTNLENAIGVVSSRTMAKQDSVVLNETAYTTLITDNLVCKLRFARISGGDTLICNFNGNNNTNSLTPYR